MVKELNYSHIDELYKNIQDILIVRDKSQFQSYLNKINLLEENFIQSYTKRKKEGGFYTTDKISQFIFSEVLSFPINKNFKALHINTLNELANLKLEDTVNLFPFLLNLTVCDPACGSGVFLVNAAETLYTLLLKFKRQSDPTKLTKQILENIFGLDINEQAIKLCRLKLLKWFYEKNQNHSDLDAILKVLESNIKIADSLTWKFSHNFDIVIGNPPYGNILSQSQKKKLKQEGVFYNEIYCAFLLKAIDWSNGTIGFIIPKSFLLRQSYITFRYNVLKKANLLRIYDVGPNMFKNATNEVQILIYEKKDSRLKNLEIYNSSGMKILTYPNQKFDLLNICKNPTCPLYNKPRKIYVYAFKPNCPYCNFKMEPMNRIRMKVNSFLFPLIERIEEKGNLNYLNVQNFPKMIRGEEAKGLVAVKQLLKDQLKGSCIFLNAKNDFMNYHYKRNKFFDIEKIKPEKLKGTNYEYYNKPKLLIKHNNTYPAAVYTEECVCFTSSIYSLLHDDKQELKFLCALLNSSIIKFYCIYGINNQINTTINLNQYMIRHLPVIEPNNEIKHFISSKVDLIINLFEQEKYNEQEIVDIQKELDDILFQLYLITKKEKDLILKSI